METKEITIEPKVDSAQEFMKLHWIFQIHLIW